MPSISFSSAALSGSFELARLLGGLLGELDDGVDHRLEVPVAEHYGAEHDVLGQLLGFRFHHQHGVLRAGDDEIELALHHLVELRIEHVFVVDEADARGADRSHERRADSVSAADAATIATTSGSFSRSCDSTVTITWVSQRQPSANSGRIGRSIRRETSVSFSVGRASRLK